MIIHDKVLSLEYIYSFFIVAALPPFRLLLDAAATVSLSGST
jgi:hypothetical protein